MSEEFNLITTSSNLPNLVKILPVDKIVFPGIISPIKIQKEYLNTIEKSINEDGYIGLFLKKDDYDVKDSSDLYDTGVLAKIIRKIITPDGSNHAIISTVKRIKIQKDLSTSPDNILFVVSYLDNIYDKEDEETKSLARLLISNVRKIVENNPMLSEEMKMGLLNFDEPGKLADLITSLFNLEQEKEQEILEILDIKERIQKVLTYTYKELELLKIQQKTQQQINEKMKEKERAFFLREQLKAIQDELGITSDKNADYKEFKKRFDKLKIKNKDVKKQIEDELERFSLMEKNSPDYQIVRNYLDILTSLPHNNEPFKNVDIKVAKEQLDKDHYGIDDVKDRILEFISVINRKKNYQGAIVCLVGPPGVGKTSVGLSIAKALGREFYRFSVGGMRDEAEIKGHRKTYIGAMPGKIIQGLKTTKTKNMVFMIDEIDKMSQSNFNGSPQSALLEVLDPEQNINFRDNYIDIPFDISNILFILTANSLETIDKPLLDRMEIIRLSGYIDEEKINIAKNYIIPKTLKKSGTDNSEVIFESDEVLSYIANFYARESGLRNFEKQISKIVRKSISEIDNKNIKPIVVSKDKVKQYLGGEIFRDEGIKITRPGMIFGLAWTSMGGDLLTIECIKIEGKGGLKLTGKLGEVMQESATISYSVIQSLLTDYGIDKDIVEKNMIHLHVPAGATPKDGPSAGITMACCLMSLLLNKQTPQDMAMTGELSLTGSILPIGGLKEKLMAAKRYNMKNILIPLDNLRDLQEIPDNIKDGLNITPVENIKQALSLVFNL